MSDSEPRVVWIPQATLNGRRDDVDIYDLGAFTSEEDAALAAERWLADRTARSGERPEILMNVVTIYDSVEDWADNR